MHTNTQLVRSWHDFLQCAKRATHGRMVLALCDKKFTRTSSILNIYDYPVKLTNIS